MKEDEIPIPTELEGHDHSMCTWWPWSEKVADIDNALRARYDLNFWERVLESVLSDGVYLLRPAASWVKLLKPLKKATRWLIFFGLDVPYVVRREGDHFILIGECYVLGRMDGKCMVGVDGDTYEEFDIW